MLKNHIHAETGGSSKLTLELTNDHETIVRQVGLLLPSASLVNSEISNALLRRLELLLREHFTKEENHLYPLLGQYLDSSVCEALTLEHENILSTATQLVESIDDGQTGVEVASQLNQLLRAHFSKEENVLFWYLDLHLPNDPACFRQSQSIPQEGRVPNRNR